MEHIDESLFQQRTYIANTPEDVQKVAGYLLALNNGEESYVKLDLPFEPMPGSDLPEGEARVQCGTLYEEFKKKNLRIVN